MSVREPAADVERLKAEIEAEKEKRRQLWKTSCEQMAEQDVEIESLWTRLATVVGQLPALLPTHRADPPRRECSPSRSPSWKDGAQEIGGHLLPTPYCITQPTHDNRPQRGKAPPVDPFFSEDSEVQLDDWLPALERASLWNGWTDEDLVIQLAGHLRGRVLLEWNLLSEDDRSTCKKASDAGNETLAAQRQDKSVPNFLRRLERTFRVAYGRDGLTPATRDALLYSQFHEGLQYAIMRSLAVSRALTYKELCVAAKNEEWRLTELKK